MQALVVQQGKTVKVEQKPIPTLKSGEVLVKIHAIGQNPTDVKHVSLGLAKPGDISGCDAAGQVVDSNGTDLQKGTRVALFTRGGQSPEHGAFAQFVKMPADLLFKMPQDMTYEEAASIPIPVFTVIQAFYADTRLELEEPRPEKSLPLPAKNEWLLVWSGASSVGQYAIQFARLSGYKVVTTASEQNWPLLKELGAEACYDYKDKDVVSKIQKTVNGSLRYALDCNAQGDSPSQISECLSTGGKLVTLLPVEKSSLAKQEIILRPTLAYTCLSGKPASFATWTCPVGKDDRGHYVEALRWVSTLFEKHLLKLLPLDKRRGLENVQQGFNDMEAGKVRAQKIVFTI